LFSSVFQLVVPIHVIKLNIKNKNCKISKILSGLIYKILRGMNTFLYGVFVSPHGGVGGPPSFFGLLIHQSRGDLAVGSGGFVFRLLLLLVLCRQLLCAFLSLTFLCGMMPFFVVGVLPMLEMKDT
jgi:hypothetical protein